MAELVMIYETTTGAIVTRTLVAADIGDEAVASAEIASGSIGSVHIADAAIASGDIAVDAIGAPHVIADGILSSEIGSGQVDTVHLAAGVSLDISERVSTDDYSAFGAIAAHAAIALISGFNNLITEANPEDIFLMPAIGQISSAALNSGDAATTRLLGRWETETGRISGSVGQLIYVGSGALPVTTPPSLSGNIQQRLGVVAADAEIHLNPSLFTVQVN